MVYLVTYDLKAPNDNPDDYERVISGIKRSYAAWAHVEKSVWLVRADEGASEIRDHVKTFLTQTDILLVAKLSGNWAGFNLGARRAGWLKKQDFLT